MDELLKRMMNEAHVALDRKGAPTTRTVPTRDDATKTQSITLSLAERIDQVGARDTKLEQAVLEIIRFGRARCGSGFGQLPLGVREAVKILLPLVSESERVKQELADFDARLARD